MIGVILVMVVAVFGLATAPSPTADHAPTNGEILWIAGGAPGMGAT